MPDSDDLRARIVDLLDAVAACPGADHGDAAESVMLHVVGPLLDPLLAALEEREDVIRGWVAYRGRVRSRERVWRGQLAAAVGFEDERGVLPQMPPLIEMVVARLAGS